MLSWICNPVAPAFVLADFYPPFSFVKFIGFTLAVSTAFKKGSMKLMEGIRFHLCASPLFHACAEGLAVADEFHVPQSFRLAAAMRLQVLRRLIASLLQLCLADGKSLLGINSVRSVRRPATVDGSSAIHLHEQTLFQGHTEHIFYRGGRKRCALPTSNAFTGTSDNDCYKKKVNCRTAFRFAGTTRISRSCFTAVIVDNCGNAEQYSPSEVPLRSIDAAHRPLTAAGG